MLYEADVLKMIQVEHVMAYDFEIYDPAGRSLGRIETLGSEAMRYYIGKWEFLVYDGTEPSLKITDAPNGVRTRFAITTAAGHPLATVERNFALLKQKLSMKRTDGSRLQLKGNMADREYSIDGPGGSIATVSRRCPTITSMFVGRDDYVVRFVSGAPSHHRKVVIATVLIVDIIRGRLRSSAMLHLAD